MAFLAGSAALASPIRRRCAIAIATGLLLFSVFRVDPEIVRAIQRAYLR